MHIKFRILLHVCGAKVQLNRRNEESVRNANIAQQQTIKKIIANSNWRVEKNEVRFVLCCNVSI